MLDALKGRPVPLVEANESAARDEELVERAKGDRNAFAPIYDLYLHPIYRYCFSRLGSKEAAEDATSVIFAKAIDRLATCRSDRFRSWLFAIAHNVVADVHRAARSVLPLESAADATDPAPSPDVIATQHDEDRFVRSLIAQLPPDQRDVVELRMAGLSGAEIARTLDRGHAAIRIAQFRAYSRLRDLFNDRTSSIGKESGRGE